MESNDKLPTKFILENIYEYSLKNPRDLTHIARGSSPRYADITKFIPEIDQLLPHHQYNLCNYYHHYYYHCYHFFVS